MWQIVTNSNIGPLLKLLFYPPITIINNLSLKICYEIVVDATFLFLLRSYGRENVLLQTCLEPWTPTANRKIKCVPSCAMQILVS